MSSVIESAVSESTESKLPAVARAKMRVKIGHLAAEAKMIRNEEKRAKLRKDFAALRELYLHRIHVVRPEIRYAHLAFAFLRDQPYRELERTNDIRQLNCSRIVRICKSVAGIVVSTEDIVTWLKA